jgi:hypothetical protein
MPSNVINGWPASAHRLLDRAALVRAPRVVPLQDRSSHRSAAATNSLDLITCSDDRLIDLGQPSAHFSESGSASDDTSYNRLDRRTPNRFQNLMCYTDP